MRLVILATLLTIVISAVPALAGEQLLVVTENFPPYNYKQDGKVVGTSTEKVRAILAEASLEYDLEVMPWPRAMRTVEDRPNTLIFSISRTLERENQFAWLALLTDNSFHLYSLKDRPNLLTRTVSEVKSKGTICVNAGSSGRSLLLNAGFRVDNLFMNTGAVDTCVKMAVVGRVEYLIGGVRTHKFTAEKHDLTNKFVRYPHILVSEQLYLGANRESDPAMLAKIKEAYTRLKASGAIKQ